MKPETKALAHKALDQLLIEIEALHGKTDLFDVCVSKCMIHGNEELLEEYITLKAEIVESEEGCHIETVVQRDEVFKDNVSIIDTVATLNSIIWFIE